MTQKYMMLTIQSDGKPNKPPKNITYATVSPRVSPITKFRMKWILSANLKYGRSGYIGKRFFLLGLIANRKSYRRDQKKKMLTSYLSSFISHSKADPCRCSNRNRNTLFSPLFNICTSICFILFLQNNRLIFWKLSLKVNVYIICKSIL